MISFEFQVRMKMADMISFEFQVRMKMADEKILHEYRMGTEMDHLD